MSNRHHESDEIIDANDFLRKVFFGTCWGILVIGYLVVADLLDWSSWARTLVGLPFGIAAGAAVAVVGAKRRRSRSS